MGRFTQKHTDHWWPRELVAQVLQCSEPLIDWFVRQGRISRVHKNGNWVYDPDDVELLLKETRQEELWKEFLAEIASGTQPAEYKSFFADLQLNKCDSGEKLLHVGAPNERVRSKLMETYSEFLSEVASKIGLRGYRFDFTCEGTYDIGWSTEAFLRRDLPPKDPLIEGLLHTRDLTTLVGRRRHGKTTFLLNLAAALALPDAEFIGHRISRPAKSLLLLLEDDPRELQDKFGRILAGRDTGGRIRLITREDFYEKNIPIDVDAVQFWESVSCTATAHSPDLIVFDNYAQIVHAAFNEHQLAHKFISTLYYSVAKEHNSSVVVAVHPRKHDPRKPAYLETDPEQFYEEAMGSSHLINSTGNLWGIQRNRKKGYTVFHGGRQRAEGQEEFTLITKDDSDRIGVFSGAQAVNLVLTTDARKSAWSALPEKFGYRDGERIVKTYLASSKSYNDFLNALKRHGMVEKGPDGKYHKMRCPVTLKPSKAEEETW